MAVEFDEAFFRGVRPAQGPGIHTDEASSALDALAEEGLTKGTLRVLREASEGTRPNPRGRRVRENPKALTIAPTKELMPLAMAITGQWGTERASLVRRLPVLGQARSNPSYPERLTQTFFERMTALEEELIRLMDAFRSRYARKGVTETSKMDWLSAFERMLDAVRWVGAQRDRSPRDRTIASDDWFLGLPRGSWSPLAAEGNVKLPYVAYSELPMATCPGAGSCGVSLGAFDIEKRTQPVFDEDGKPALYKSGPKVGKPKTKTKVIRGQKGWCYSFKAWRHPAAFLRQFLNTLANYADREFAILAAGGPADPRRYEQRVRAAIDGGKLSGTRVWIAAVEAMALELTAKGRTKKPTFVRLFVDGDVNTEDQIYEWMSMCKRIGPGGTRIRRGMHHVEVYGYSKCWQQFVNVHETYGEKWWPKNYVVNLSSGSVYASSAPVLSAIRGAMEKLPVARGYFEAVDLDRYIRQLEAQTKLIADDPHAVIPMPAPRMKFEQFRFSPDRIRTFLRINGVKTVEQALVVVPEAKTALARIKKPTEDKIRQKTFHVWLDGLVRDPAFGAFVRKELARDKDSSQEPAYYDNVERIQREALARVLTGEGDAVEDDPQHVLLRKALSLVLQEVLWTYGLGGSCPLVCGNCSDHPSVPAEGVHRCASKPGSAFWDATIHIGLH